MSVTDITTPDHIRLPADVSYMAGLGEWLRASCRARDVAPSRTAGLELAVHEVAVNIIRHAYSGEGSEWIDVHLSCHERGIVVTIEDTGMPYDPESAVAPDLSVPQEGGYGLYLIQRLVDHVEYQRTAFGNRWELRLDSGRSI